MSLRGRLGRVRCGRGYDPAMLDRDEAECSRRDGFLVVPDFVRPDERAA